MTAVFIVAGVGTLVVLVAAPFLLAWQHHLRWLIAAATPTDPCSVGAAPLVGLEEVTVRTVTSGPSCGSPA